MSAVNSVNMVYYNMICIATQRLTSRTEEMQLGIFDFETVLNLRFVD